VLEIRRAGHEAAPHLSCIASSRADIAEQLERYRESGIRHIVALRGDLPSGLASSGELRYASELVAFIRETSGDWFRIEVACYPEFHPQTRSAEDEIRHFKRKVDAGADAAITQYFYNADAYFRFVADACGAEIPRWMRFKLDSYRDDSASIREFGLEVVTAMCRKLIEAGAPGLHFYTLNQASLSVEIWRRLGL
jgi:methylenetetrahydrofolate reductase (NADPH)